MADFDPIKDFGVPLNVFASSILKEEGSIEYLHYGLFSHPEDSITTAQRRAADLLWDRLPTPCRILDVDIGLGTMLSRLLAAGYAATGITPDKVQIPWVWRHLGKTAPLLSSRFETFAMDAGTWRLILFQQSSQYIDSIDLFEGANRLLADDGEIIVMDEFSLRRESHEYEPLHYLPHFLALAKRSGFAVAECIDLSAAAAPTLIWLRKALERHADNLRKELNLSAHDLSTLEAANRRYATGYDQGHYGYFLLRLKRVAQPHWQPGRIIGDGRAAEMRALFAQVFGHEMSPAHWQWKYGEGRGAGVGIWRKDGKMVAHYGGTSRDISFFGHPERAFQACDLMVAESDRGSLSRKGPAFLAAATFLEHELGYSAPHLLGIGFPTERAYRLPERLGLYVGALARIQEVSWPVLHTHPSLLLKIREIDLLADTSGFIANNCWENMRTSMFELVVGVRDATYLRHRYALHPDKRYRAFHVSNRFGSRPLGLIVLHLPDASTDGRCELLDVVGALGAMPLLIHNARRVAAAFGYKELFAWLADNMLPLLALPPEVKIQDLNVIVPGNNWTPAPPNEQVIGKWWLTGGDTDFR